MAKTQLNVRLDEDTAAAARAAAARRQMSVQDYFEHLVRTDTDPRRAIFMEAAQGVIDELGDFIEDRASAARG